MRARKPIIGSVAVERDGKTVSAGDADQRRAAHHHGADCLGDFAFIAEIAEGEAVRQHGLVEHSDAALPVGTHDRSVGAAIDFHCAILHSKAVDGIGRHSR